MNNYFYKIVCISLVAIGLFLFSACSKTIENSHDDILPLLIEMPQELEFVSSKVGSDQIVLEASYRVSGVDAHRIEELLHSRYGMARLKFVCCAWEPSQYGGGEVEITEQFDNIYKQQYKYNTISITMYSEETSIQDRTQWSDIGYFYVVVEVVNI